MSKKNGYLTTEEHLQNAADLDMASFFIGLVVDRCAAAGLPKSGKIMKVLSMLDPGNRRGVFETVRVILEHDYQDGAGPEIFNDLGFVYRGSRCRRRKGAK